MPYAQMLPLLLSIMVGLVIAMVTWGFFRERGDKADSSLIGTRDEILLGLLALAAFASGVFVTMVLLIWIR